MVISSASTIPKPLYLGCCLQHGQNLCTWLHSIPYGPPTFPIDFTGHLCEYELRTTHIRLCILRSPRALGYLGNKNWDGLDAGVPEYGRQRESCCKRTPFADVVYPTMHCLLFLTRPFAKHCKAISQMAAAALRRSGHDGTEMPLAIHFNTIIHPFTLADNLHYVFLRLPYTAATSGIQVRCYPSIYYVRLVDD
jgi:hypothetical protein